MSDLEGAERWNMGSSSLDSVLCNEISLQWERFGFCTVQWVREVWILHCAVMDLDSTLGWEPFEEVSANTTKLIHSNEQFVFYNGQSFSRSRIGHFPTSHHGQELLRCQCVQVNYLGEICICLNYRGKGTLYFYRTILSTILRLLQKIVPELLENPSVALGSPFPRPFFNSMKFFWKNSQHNSISPLEVGTPPR